MKQIAQLIVVCLLALASAWQQAQAQMIVKLEPVRRDFMVGENPTLKLTIANYTDASIPLTSIPGKSWLHLQITRAGNSLPETPQAAARYPALTLTPGSIRSYNIGLSPQFRMSKPGTYQVVAMVRLPDQSTYTSNTALVNVVEGADIRSFTVQARGRRLKLALQMLRVRGTDVLFGQVKDVDTQQVLGATYLGQYMSFMPPKVMLDRSQNMHMLCQSDAKYFTYAVMNAKGECSHRQIMQRSGGPVDLVSTGAGVRCIGVVPYVKPKQEREKMHSASERP